VIYLISLLPCPFLFCSPLSSAVSPLLLPRRLPFPFSPLHLPLLLSTFPRPLLCSSSFSRTPPSLPSTLCSLLRQSTSPPPPFLRSSRPFFSSRPSSIYFPFPSRSFSIFPPASCRPPASSPSSSQFFWSSPLLCVHFFSYAPTSLCLIPSPPSVPLLTSFPPFRLHPLFLLGSFALRSSTVLLPPLVQLPLLHLPFTLSLPLHSANPFSFLFPLSASSPWILVGCSSSLFLINHKSMHPIRLRRTVSIA